MKRGITVSVRCAQPGCRESSFYEYASRREMLASTSHIGWLCVRHLMKDGVLTPDRLRVEWTSEPSHEENGHRYWGHSGVIIGKGHYAEAKDFPVGTVVKITCEVIFAATAPDGAR